METIISEYVPSTWDLSAGDEVIVPSDSAEYKELIQNFNNASCTASLKRLHRLQNKYTYGQFLIREQFHVANVPCEDFYRVRRYMKIKPEHLNTALKYNLDQRRINGNNQGMFTSQLHDVNPNDVVIVVQLLTTAPCKHDHWQEHSSDYFVEYVAYF